MYLPTTVSASKRRKLEDAGASLVLYGEDTVDTEMEARKKAMERELPYISPYNDIQVRQAHRIHFLQAIAHVFLKVNGHKMCIRVAASVSVVPL